MYEREWELSNTNDDQMIKKHKLQPIYCHKKFYFGQHGKYGAKPYIIM